MFASCAYRELAEQTAERQERLLAAFDRLESAFERNQGVGDEAIAEPRAQRKATRDRLDGGEQRA